MKTEKTITVCDFCKRETCYKCGVCQKDVCRDHIWQQWHTTFTWYQCWTSVSILVCNKCMNEVTYDSEAMYELSKIAYEAEKLSKELVTKTFYEWLKEKRNNKFNRRKFMESLFSTRKSDYNKS